MRGVIIMKMSSEMLTHLQERIIPFWDNLRDDDNGGFYGYMDFNHNLDKKAVKGCILNSRILWFYSAVYNLTKDKKYLKNADHAYEFLKNIFLDEENGGVYWMATYDGKVNGSMKHTYNQAFAIYALAEYYRANGKEEALGIAKDIFNTIETHCKDSLGYLEQFDKEWHEIDNIELSENGVISKKTTNTHLHILEAYTNLYTVWKDERVKKQLLYVMDKFRNTIYDEKNNWFRIFFDQKWNVSIEVQSYGHDIETCWLLKRAADVIGDEELIKDTVEYTTKVAEKIYETAYTDHGLHNECVEGKLNTDRVWWVQAEAVIGFYNNFQLTGDKKYYEASCNMWEYIKNYMVEKRADGDWYWLVAENGKPYEEKPIVEPWKCPYHTGRMCMEIIRRTM